MILSNKERILKGFKCVWESCLSILIFTLLLSQDSSHPYRQDQSNIHTSSLSQLKSFKFLCQIRWSYKHFTRTMNLLRYETWDIFKLITIIIELKIYHHDFIKHHNLVVIKISRPSITPYMQSHKFSEPTCKIIYLSFNKNPLICHFI